MTERFVVAAVCFAIILVMVPRCGIYAKADVQAGSPVYGEQRGSQVLAWGYAINLGTAAARYVTVTLTVIAAGARTVLETHRLFLGDLEPQEKVKFEAVLTSVKWGDDVNYRTEFDWE